jgi:hypothetical protein
MDFTSIKIMFCSVLLCSGPHLSLIRHWVGVDREVWSSCENEPKSGGKLQGRTGMWEGLLNSIQFKVLFKVDI